MSTPLVFETSKNSINSRYSQFANWFQFRLKLDRDKSRSCHNSTKIRKDGDIGFEKVDDDCNMTLFNDLKEHYGNIEGDPSFTTLRKAPGHKNLIMCENWKDFRMNKKQRGAKKVMQSTTNQAPHVRLIGGKRVTIVDEKLKVFVMDLLTPETCELVRKMTDDHVREVHDNGNRTPTWRTLYTYTKQDLPCCEVKNLSELVTNSITESVKDAVGEIYHKKIEAAKLRERSWKEPHLLLYQHVEGKPLHTGVGMHYDGCHISWICMLSKSTDYEGGGTYIRALRTTIKLKQGQVLVFPGELYHQGCDITDGVRAMIVCFLDGFDPEVTDPSSYKTDREEWQKNIISY